MKIAWQSIEPPLAAVAVAGPGIIGERLAARAEQDQRWMLVRFAEWTLVVGDDLPWVDGVTYLGQLAQTEVLVPVHRRPQVHSDLVVKAVRSLTGGGVSPRVALIPESPRDVDGRVAVLLLPLGPEDSGR